MRSNFATSWAFISACSEVDFLVIDHSSTCNGGHNQGGKPASADDRSVLRMIYFAMPSLHPAFPPIDRDEFRRGGRGCFSVGQPFIASALARAAVYSEER
jgi:hypothetical protein